MGVVLRKARSQQRCAERAKGHRRTRNSDANER